MMSKCDLDRDQYAKQRITYTIEKMCSEDRNLYDKDEKPCNAFEEMWRKAQ